MKPFRQLQTFALAALLCASADAADVKLRLIGAHALPSGALHEGVEFGGISGMDRFDDGSYVAISDDRGAERGAPRFYRLALDTGSGRVAGQYACALPPIPTMGLSRLPASSDNGHRTLVLVADNNFSARQRSLFMVFEVQQGPGLSADPGR